MSKEFDPTLAAANGYTLEDWQAVADNPEWTAEDVARARPFSDVFPDLARSAEAEIRRRGPARTKTPVSIRLDDDLVAKLRASGPGWQSRVNDAIRRWVDEAA